MLLRNFDDKRPLVSTLSKYVKVVRVEHCFLLFEELGKSDKWLQCLEVSTPLSLSHTVVMHFDFLDALNLFILCWNLGSSNVVYSGYLIL